MTTKGHFLKEPSIMLFLSNRHKKRPEESKSLRGIFFPKLQDPFMVLANHYANIYSTR